MERRDWQRLTHDILGWNTSDPINAHRFLPDSRTGLKGVGFRKDGRIYPFEQFDLKFNRPDIVLQQIGLASEGQVAAYRQAYEKRLRKMGFKEEQLGSNLHLPMLQMLTADIPLSTDKTSIRLKFKASDEEDMLDRLNVFVNDVPIHGTKGIPIADKHSHIQVMDLDIPLAAGSNKIQVSVLNQRGMESLRSTLNVTSTASPSTRHTYILAIGVSEYKDRNYNLTYAAKDAYDFADAYLTAQQEHPSKDHVHVLLLTNEQATRTSIRTAKQWLRQATVNDRVIVFTAGHGVTDVQLNYYFGTHDIDLSNPADRGLPYEDLDDLLDGVLALQKLLLIDTCFSGEIDNTAPHVMPVSEDNRSDGKETVQMRAFSPIRGVQIVGTSKPHSPTDRVDSNVVNFQEDWFADLRRGTGAVVISASSGDEYSVEYDDLKNGVFTYSVLKGLKLRAADHDHNGLVTVSELQRYVTKEVKRLTNGGQNPTVRQDNLENDFVVY